MTLAGRVAVITGASSGIGLACAEALAREGVAVVLGARRTERPESEVKRIRSTGARAEAVTTDVTVEADVIRLVHHAHSTFGRIDVMICNAGFGYYGTVEETPPEVMQRMMDVNFMGTYYGARAAMPFFRAQGHGHLLLISSIVGRRGIPLMSGYSAPSSRRRTSTSAPSTRSRPIPSTVRRWSATTDNPCPGWDRDSPSSTSRRRSYSASGVPAPRSTRIRSPAHWPC
jgi:NAD(P)-dependent dehydrogenase (short-subunit alcohol dehydrogenase family)